MLPRNESAVLTHLVRIHSRAVAVKPAANDPLPYTAWFFDVEKRPIEAIGLVTGALTILDLHVWSAARALI